MLIPGVFQLEPINRELGGTTVIIFLLGIATNSKVLNDLQKMHRFLKFLPFVRLEEELIENPLLPVSKFALFQRKTLWKWILCCCQIVFTFVEVINQFLPTCWHLQANWGIYSFVHLWRRPVGRCGLPWAKTAAASKWPLRPTWALLFWCTWPAAADWTLI